MFARDLLNKTLGTSSLSLADLRHIQAMLDELETAVRARAKRFSVKSKRSTYQDNDAFNTWAKMLLWSMGDQYWWFLDSPLLNRALNQAWNDAQPRYVD